MKNISSWVFVTASLLSLPGAASAQTDAAGVPLTTEEATAFIKGKSLSATRLAGGTPSLQFKDNGTIYGKTVITAAAVIPEIGGLKTASCACAGSGGNTKAAASWFAWAAKSSTFTRMQARYISFLTIRTEFAMYSVANYALKTRATRVFILLVGIPGDRAGDSGGS